MTFPIDGWDLVDTDDLQNPEFELGGMQWRIRKLMPVTAKVMLYRHVFPIFSEARAAMPEPNEENPPTMRDVMFAIISACDHVHMEAMSAKFISDCIDYKNDAGQWMPITKDFEYATQKMLPIEFVLLDIRAFAVNFGESASKVVEEIMKRAAVADESTSQSEPIHSSTPESMQDTIPLQTSKRGRPKGTRK